MIMATEAEKTFDNIQHPFVQQSNPWRGYMALPL